jgi:hypothetical protein
MQSCGHAPSGKHLACLCKYSHSSARMCLYVYSLRKLHVECLSISNEQILNIRLLHADI